MSEHGDYEVKGVVSTWDDDQHIALFQAFLAGFDASGEGFNGEYVSGRWKDRPTLEKYLHDLFDGEYLR